MAADDLPYHLSISFIRSIFRFRELLRYGTVIECRVLFCFAKPRQGKRSLLKVIYGIMKRAERLNSPFGVYLIFRSLSCSFISKGIR